MESKELKTKVLLTALTDAMVRHPSGLLRGNPPQRVEHEEISTARKELIEWVLQLINRLEQDCSSDVERELLYFNSQIALSQLYGPGLVW